MPSKHATTPLDRLNALDRELRGLYVDQASVGTEKAELTRELKTLPGRLVQARADRARGRDSDDPDLIEARSFELRRQIEQLNARTAALNVAIARVDAEAQETWITGAGWLLRHADGRMVDAAERVCGRLDELDTDLDELAAAVGFYGSAVAAARNPDGLRVDLGAVPLPPIDDLRIAMGKMRAGALARPHRVGEDGRMPFDAASQPAGTAA